MSILHVSGYLAMLHIYNHVGCYGTYSQVIFFQLVYAIEEHSSSRNVMFESPQTVFERFDFQSTFSIEMFKTEFYKPILLENVYLNLLSVPQNSSMTNSKDT